MKTLKKIVVLASIFAATALTAGSASAAGCDLLSSGGFVANIITCAAPQTAPVIRPLDVMNGKMGRPFERGVATGMNSIFPGSGNVMNGIWEMQNSGGMNPPPFYPPQQAGGMNQPPFYPPQQAGPWGNGVSPQPSLSNFCVTQVGRFFGPVNPVGTSCFVMTPNGPIFGQVG